jgi:hypothetical protein
MKTIPRKIGEANGATFPARFAWFEGEKRTSVPKKLRCSRPARAKGFIGVTPGL